MEINVVPSEVKIKKTYTVVAKVTFTEEELESTASYQLTKKQLFEKLKKTEVTLSPS